MLASLNITQILHQPNNSMTASGVLMQSFKDKDMSNNENIRDTQDDQPKNGNFSFGYALDSLINRDVAIRRTCWEET